VSRACRALRVSRASQPARVCLAAALALGLLAASARSADLRAPGETPVADVLQLLVLEREIVAIDGLAGTEIRHPLERGENVLFAEARGRVGIALTDRRVLAVAVRSGAWQETRYRRGEPPPAGAFLGEQVALVVTTKRALGFDGGSGNLVERSLGPRETVLAADASGAVGVIVTDRRALGVSPFAGGLFETKLRVEETLEAVAATGNFATVRTSRRLLTFQALTGAWVESALR
jgi:hypothetical protein